LFFVQRWAQHAKWIAPLVAMAGLAVLYLFSPERYGFYPRCLFRELTGLDCPGCGSLRSVHHLLHGEIATAFLFNPLLYFLVPALLVCRRHLHRPAWLWSFAGIVLLFTVARNL
jgi:hypothetical protein